MPYKALIFNSQVIELSWCKIMPNIYNALVVKGRDTVRQQINVTCEIQQLLGNNTLTFFIQLKILRNK